MREYRAPELTQIAARWLARRYPGALIVEELSIGNWGSLRLDVAAIRSDGIAAVEIKGDGDDMSRLSRQGPLYALAADKAWLLASPKLTDKARKARPQGWGLLWLDEVPGSEPKLRSMLASPRLPNSPGQMLQALWAAELRRLCDTLSVPRKGLTCVDEWTDALAEAVPLSDLRPAVCAALRNRDWYGSKGITASTCRPGRVRWAEEVLNPAKALDRIVPDQPEPDLLGWSRD